MGNTCVKRSVLGAGNREAAVKRAAAAVQAAANQLQQRVLPHPTGARRAVGSAIPHGAYTPPGGSGSYGPLDAIPAFANAMSAFATAIDSYVNDVPALSANNAKGKVALRILYQPYVEPMFIPNPTDELIMGTVMCGRAVPTATPTERLLNGTECDFDFVGTQLRINSIDGMTPDPTKMITWTFVYFGI